MIHTVHLNEGDITRKDVMAVSRAARSLHSLEVLESLRYKLNDAESRHRSNGEMRKFADAYPKIMRAFGIDVRP